MSCSGNILWGLVFIYLAFKRLSKLLGKKSIWLTSQTLDLKYLLSVNNIYLTSSSNFVGWLNNYDNTYQISQDKIMSNVECYLIDKKFSDDNEYSKPAFGY